MSIKTILLTAITFTLLSFSADKGTVDFSYPKNKDAVISLKTDKFKKFDKEWRGEDYYYSCENGKDGLICSVLFYKLDKEEEKTMVEPSGPIAGIAYIYFSTNSNLKRYEKNDETWGDVTDEFMFRQNNILEFEGVKMRQKHMYAYGMLGKDLFVNVHLSKTNYTTEDSTEMRRILASITKKK